MTDTNTGLNELMALLIKKKGLLSRILTLTKEQPEHIAGDEIEGLMNNIEQRQKVVDEINLIDSEILKFKPLNKPDPKIGAIYSEIKELLLGIQAQDAENEKAAIKRKDELQAQIKKFNTVQKNNNSPYDGIKMSGATYFDKMK